LKKFLLGVITALAVVCIILAIRWSRDPYPLRFDTTYQAVLLDNGQVYYGKVDRIGDEFSILTDVYYIQNQVDPQTKEVKNILIRRGNEWHSPNRTIVATRHVVMIEPVTPGSKVAELIAALKGKNQ
jgi:hypothetical protein